MKRSLSLLSLSCVVVLAPSLLAQVSPAPGLFTGQYAMLLHGTNHASPDGAQEVVEIGSVLSDGAGHILAAEVDVNSTSSTYASAPLSGSYTLGGDGRGTMQLVGPGTEQNFAIFVNPAGPVKTINVIETDQFGITGSGTMEQQTVPASLAGTWTMHLEGEAPCVANCEALPLSDTHVLSSGLLRIGADGTVGADVNQAIGSRVSIPLQLTGAVLGAMDAFGRLPFTLTIPLELPGEPQNFVLYAVGADKLFLLSKDGHANFALQTGTATN